MRKSKYLILGLLVFVFMLGFFGMNKVVVEATSKPDKPFFTTKLAYNDMAAVGDCYVLRDKSEFETFAATQLERQGMQVTSEQIAVYKEFGDKFFDKYNLVIALIARGSGSLRFELTNTTVKDDILHIDLKDISPLMQTCDYRQWSLILPVEKTIEYNNAVISISK